MDATRERQGESPRESGGLRCPFCHDGLGETELVARCGACSTAYHPSCWDDARGCSVLGCPGKVALVAGRTPSQNFGPGRTSSCASCHSPIGDDENAFFCQRCMRAHHPLCSERAGGCIRCGQRGGVLVSPRVFRREFFRPRVAGIFLTSSIGLSLAPSIIAIVFSFTFHKGWLLPLGIGGLVLALVQLGTGIYFLTRSWAKLAAAKSPAGSAPAPGASVAPPAKKDG